MKLRYSSSTYLTSGIHNIKHASMAINLNKLSVTVFDRRIVLQGVKGEKDVVENYKIKIVVGRQN
jgi:hypothetical protein